MNNNQNIFLDNFEKTLSIKKAAEATGISRSIVYKWKRDDTVFNEEFEKISINEEFEKISINEEFEKISISTVGKAEKSLLELLNSDNLKIKLKATKIVLKSKIAKKYSELSTASTFNINDIIKYKNK